MHVILNNVNIFVVILSDLNYFLKLLSVKCICEFWKGSLWAI